MGPLKGVLRGTNGPEKAKSRSFGDGNVIFGRQAQCDKIKQKETKLHCIFFGWVDNGHIPNIYSVSEK